MPILAQGARAFSECSKTSNSLVQSVPALDVMISSPPGWLPSKGFKSYTRLWMIIQGLGTGSLWVRCVKLRLDTGYPRTLWPRKRPAAAADTLASNDMCFTGTLPRCAWPPPLGSRREAPGTSPASLDQGRQSKSLAFSSSQSKPCSEGAYMIRSFQAIVTRPMQINSKPPKPTEPQKHSSGDYRVNSLGSTWSEAIKVTFHTSESPLQTWLQASWQHEVCWIHCSTLPM